MKKIITRLMSLSLLVNTLPLVGIAEEVGATADQEKINMLQQNDNEAVLLDSSQSAELTRTTEEDYSQSSMREDWVEGSGSTETADSTAFEEMKESSEEQMDIVDQDAVRSQAINQLMMRATSVQSEFIASVAAGAKRLGKEYGLYSSVMIAQASLESNWGRSTLASAPNYNLFGIKGDYKGNFVLMDTIEWDAVNKKWITVKAKFRKYPNYEESMRDNAVLLRYGLSWDSGFYKGTWLENTSSYKDSTSYLTGRYATDPGYDGKLNTIIESNNLSRFDQVFDGVISETSIDRVVSKVVTTTGNHGVYNGIYNTNSEVKWIGGNFTYNNKLAVITSEAVTTRSTYLKFEIDGVEIGWMDKKAFHFYDGINAQQPVANLQAKIVTNVGTHGTYNGIYNTSPTVRWIGSNQNYGGQVATITEEAITPRATYVKFSIGGKEIGWMDKQAFSYYDEVLKQQVVANRQVKVLDMAATHGLYNGIYNTSPIVRWIGNNKEYRNQGAVLTEEAVTGRATYVKFSIGGKEIGWMDKRAFHFYEEVLTTQVSSKKEAKILASSGNHGVYNGAYNTSASVRGLGNNKQYHGQVAILGQEVTTTRATYVNFSIGGKEIGWMDKRAFTFYDDIVKRQTVNQTATILGNSGTHGLYNGVYNTNSAVRWVGNNKQYDGKSVKISEEVTTSRATYVKFSLDGKEIGWMDRRAFSYK